MKELWVWISCLKHHMWFLALCASKPQKWPCLVRGYMTWTKSEATWKKWFLAAAKQILVWLWAKHSSLVFKDQNLIFYSGHGLNRVLFSGKNDRPFKFYTSTCWNAEDSTCRNLPWQNRQFQGTVLTWINKNITSDNV